MMANASKIFQRRGRGTASNSASRRAVNISTPRCLRSTAGPAGTIFYSLKVFEFKINSQFAVTQVGIEKESRGRYEVGTRFQLYFFSRLVWLATHCQRPSVNTQVSVKRPQCS